MADLKLLSPMQCGALYNILFGAQARGAVRPTIAGGVLRDTLLDRAVADIDVFHEDALANTEGLIETPIGKSDYEKPIKIWTQPVKSEADLPIQYIQVGNLWDRFDRFSCPLSEVFYDLRGELRMTSAFMDAVTNKRLAFRTHASEPYKAKMRQKFWHWSIETGSSD